MSLDMVVVDSQRRRVMLACAAGGALTGCASMAPPVPPAQWQAFRLPGKRSTLYRWSEKDGRPGWHARADRSASMWRRDAHLAPDRIGEVEFSWWVSQTIPTADMRRADTEDAPARVIFAFEGDESRLSPRNRMLFEMARALTGEAPPYATLMYVWANQTPENSVIVNPRLDRIRKLVVESGDTQLRRWRHYRRNLRDDFIQAFGEPPGALKGIALMTDSDNTGARAEAWYGAVRVQGLPDRDA